MKTCTIYRVDWKWKHGKQYNYDFYMSEETARNFEKKVVEDGGSCFITKLIAHEEYLEGIFVAAPY